MAAAEQHIHPARMPAPRGRLVLSLIAVDTLARHVLGRVVAVRAAWWWRWPTLRRSLSCKTPLS